MNAEELKIIDEKINQANEEIKELKKQKKLLQQNDNIAEYVKVKRHTYRFGRGIIETQTTSKPEKEWDAFRKLGMELFRGKCYPLKQTELSAGQKQIAAQFIDEITPIWNKYITMIYRGYENE